MPKKPALTLESDSPFTDAVSAPPASEGPPAVPDLSSAPPVEPVPLADVPEGEAPKPKRKHTRRTRAQIAADEAAAAEQGPPPVSAEDMERTVTAFAVTFRAVSAGIASRRGEHWRLTDEECGTLGKVWADAVAPYLHKVGPAVPWVSAAVVTWTVFQPRITADQEKARLAAVPT